MAHFLEITQEDERLIIAPIFHSKKEQNEFRKIVFEKLFCQRGRFSTIFLHSWKYQQLP